MAFDPFENSCFVSYCRGDGLLKWFSDQLTTALRNYVVAYVKKKVWRDVDELNPGAGDDQKIAKAICRSVCMIVAYVPSYEESDYCLREFAAMEELEQRRAHAIGAGKPPGMIIPVLLRGKMEDLPERICKGRTVCDFTSFFLATKDMELKLDPQCIPQIERICQYIREVYEQFKKAGVDPTCTCGEFALPEHPPEWRQVPAPPFPGRVLLAGQGASPAGQSSMGRQ